MLLDRQQRRMQRDHNAFLPGGPNVPCPTRGSNRSPGYQMECLNEDFGIATIRRLQHQCVLGERCLCDSQFLNEAGLHKVGPGPCFCSIGCDSLLRGNLCSQHVSETFPGIPTLKLLDVMMCPDIHVREIFATPSKNTLLHCRLFRGSLSLGSQ